LSASKSPTRLLRTAVLLTGSKEVGEDLPQTAVERLLRRWRRFDGDPEGYLRRTLCNLATDGYRRAGRWRQKERLLRTGLRQAPDATGDVDLRDARVRLMLQLRSRQRPCLCCGTGRSSPTPRRRRSSAALRAR
jgi:DNA-directed RNA polymerase specialized sigma24 family protein